jgi:hypothetical protein
MAPHRTRIFHPLQTLGFLRVCGGGGGIRWGIGARVPPAPLAGSPGPLRQAVFKKSAERRGLLLLFNALERGDPPEIGNLNFWVPPETSGPLSAPPWVPPIRPFPTANRSSRPRLASLPPTPCRPPPGPRPHVSARPEADISPPPRCTDRYAHFPNDFSDMITFGDITLIYREDRTT